MYQGTNQNDPQCPHEKLKETEFLERTVRYMQSIAKSNPNQFTQEDSKRILVSWPYDINNWYYAEVTSFDQSTFKHHLVYQDGEEEDVVLFEERFIQNHYLAEPGIVTILDIGGVNPKQSPE